MATKKLDILLSAKGAVQTERAIGRVGSSLRNLNRIGSAFGAGAGLNTLMGIGSGAAVFVLAVKGFELVANAAESVRDAVRGVSMGLTSWREELEDIAYKIPITGSVLRIGDAIFGTISPEERQKRLKDMFDLAKGLRNLQDELRATANTRGKTGLELDFANIENAFRKMDNTISDRIFDLRRKLDTTFDPFRRGIIFQQIRGLEGEQGRNRDRARSDLDVNRIKRQRFEEGPWRFMVESIKKGMITAETEIRGFAMETDARWKVWLATKPRLAWQDEIWHDAFEDMRRDAIEGQIDTLLAGRPSASGAPSVIDSPLITGAGAASREKAMSDLARQNKEIRDQVKGLRDDLNKGARDVIKSLAPLLGFKQGVF